MKRRTGPPSKLLRTLKKIERGELSYASCEADSALKELGFCSGLFLIKEFKKYLSQLPGKRRRKIARVARKVREKGDFLPVRSFVWWDRGVLKTLPIDYDLRKIKGCKERQREERKAEIAEGIKNKIRHYFSYKSGLTNEEIECIVRRSVEQAINESNHEF